MLRESTRGLRAESVDVLNDSLESWNSNLCFASGLIGQYGSLQIQVLCNVTKSQSLKQRGKEFTGVFKY